MLLRIYLFIFLTVFGTTCATQEPPPVIEVTAQPIIQQPPPTSAQMIAALDKVAVPGSHNAAAVEDIRWLFLGIDQEQRGNLAEAVGSYFKAVKSSQGAFAEKAFEYWLKAYALQLGKKTEIDMFAKLVLAETNKGKASSFMQEEGLNNEGKLASYLKEQIPEWVIDPLKVDMARVEKQTQPGINFSDLQKSDPLLDKTAQDFCKASDTEKKSSPKIIPQALQQYLDGLIEICQDKPEIAITHLRSSMANLAEKKEFRALAVNAALRLIAVYKGSGRRSEIYQTYVELVKIWAMGDLPAASFQESDYKLALRRINDVLWTARYAALAGDYTNAKLYGNQALDFVAVATVKYSPSLAEKQREELTNYKAEAYHTLASRIALEQKEFDTAISLSTLGVMIPNLNSEWTERFNWDLGLYSYIAGEYNGALRNWEKLLEQTTDESLRPKLYFWLAKTYEILNKKSESQFYYDALIAEFPISFYSVVAPSASNFEQPERWRENFTIKDKNPPFLTDLENFELDVLRNHKSIGPLLLRAEVLVAANLDQWTKVAVNELSRKVQKEIVFAERNASAFVYLSRLQYAAGSYLSTISLTSDLAKSDPKFWRKWPEQLMVYFPRPYADVFSRHAGRSQLNAEQLMAISRQETSFRSEVKSGAGAIGLMQLVPATASRFAKEAGFAKEAKLPTNDVAERLKDPDFNVGVGSAYLSFLSRYYKGFDAAVYAGYNAGEYAVDQWLQRRGQTDPLIWIEVIPFGETKEYIKNVWRNYYIYKFLNSVDSQS